MTLAGRNYHRIARVSLNGTVIAQCKAPPVNGHRIAFRCLRTHRAEPNTVSVQVYGLAPERRAEITRAFEVAQAKITTQGDTLQGWIHDVHLEIGYGDAMATLIRADIVEISHDDAGPAATTTVEGHDGGAPWRGSFVNETAMPGVSVDMLRTVFEAVEKIGFHDADSEQVFRSALQGFSKTEVQGGFVMQGPPMKVAVDLFEGMGLAFSVQNGKAMLFPFNKPINDRAVDLSPATGLLRRPIARSRGRVGLLCQAHPLLTPGRQVIIRNERGVLHGAGCYRVDSAESTGDTHSGVWETVVEASPSPAVNR